jgi:hypothetical protein
LQGGLAMQRLRGGLFELPSCVEFCRKVVRGS